MSGALFFDTPSLRQELMLQFVDLFGIRRLDRSDETRDAPCFGIPTFGGLPGHQSRSGRPARPESPKRNHLRRD